MVPWTEAFVANAAGEGKCEKDVCGVFGCVRPVTVVREFVILKLAQRYWQLECDIDSLARI
jgi:hypothetical protein